MLRDVCAWGEGSAAAIEFSGSNGQHRTDPASSQRQCLLIQRRGGGKTLPCGGQGYPAVVLLSVPAAWARWLLLPAAKHQCRAPVLRGARASLASSSLSVPLLRTAALTESCEL